jgi:hypothetical protein
MGSTLVILVAALALTVALVVPARAAFTEAAALYGFAAGDSMSYAAAFPDYDGDGDPELYVNHHWKGPADFYRNDGTTPWLDLNSHFIGTPPDRHDCLWGDLNNDGTPDQYIIHGGDQPKELFWNRGGGILRKARDRRACRIRMAEAARSRSSTSTTTAA